MVFSINKMWNGQTYSLEKFSGLHHNYYIQLEEAEEHDQLQFRTEQTWVGYLLDKIKNNNPYLIASLSGIQINMNEMRNDFDLEVTFYYPSIHILSIVQKKSPQTPNIRNCFEGKN